MSLFGQTKRHTPTSKPRRSPLPVFTSELEAEKFGLSGGQPLSGWFSVIYVPLPRLSRSTVDSPSLGSGFATSKNYHPHQSQRRRYARICVPIPPRLYARFPRVNSKIRGALALLLVAGIVIFFLGFRRSRDGRNTWSPPFVDPDTTVLTTDEIASIWEWEVLSGHHPNLASVPENIPLASNLLNPAVPAAMLPAPSSPSPLVAYHQRTTIVPKSHILGAGPERHYISTWESVEPHPGFPPRPTPGSVMDLDLVLERCDLSGNKYVRDCLEFLRIGGGLDNGRRVRRGNYLSQFKQSYLEDAPPTLDDQWTPKLPKIRSPGLSREPLSLSPPKAVTSTYTASDPCDSDYPRLFHMFWAGAFTDKPYMAVMSFLYTQNLGLDVPADQHTSSTVKDACRPQFWVWINPGPAAAVPNPSAKREMYEQLATNPWSAPFLHERFRDVVKFKMWNTTEQLDGIPVLKEHWRAMPIFNSGGNTYNQPAPQQTPQAIAEGAPLGDILEAEAEAQVDAAAEPVASKKGKGGLFEKVGSSSESDYDRLSVILSDMARFVLTHRFGGVYLDADTIFLRDWEELWNYRGQFAYRWSYHQKYNTAVLKLHKGSALGTFLFKTALENGLDFHPMTVSRYLKDAGLDKLLFRVPDALFDPAWLNMERYQRERPPFPYFPEFSVFFSNDRADTAGPQPLGFDGFFRGAYSYHFHNFWWLPFDPSRNWPDLGTRFIKGENTLKEASIQNSSEQITPGEESETVTGREDMDDEVDLSWATVLKRTFESYLRAERPNMYGEWLEW